MSSQIKGSSSRSQPLENPDPTRGDIATLEHHHKAGYERIPAHGEFDDLLNAQIMDALEVSDSSNEPTR